MRYAMGSASMAHTYGNVTTFMNQWLLDLFPKNYFKTNFINSTIAYRNFTQYTNKRKEFLKKDAPMLIMKPRIETDVIDDIPINQTYLANRIYDIASDDIETGNLQNFFYDKENHRQIQFLMNGLRINFDVSLIVDTLMEQVNLFYYFKNRVRQEWTSVVIADLESFISRDIMYLLALDAGYEDVFIDGKRMGEFLSYVNSHSMYPVTVKYKNSSGRHEFFRFHPVHLNITIQGLSMDEGNKRGQITDNFMINFSVRCDFVTAGLYNYVSDNEEIFDNFTPTNEITNVTNIIPIITPQKIYSNSTLPAGWNMYIAPAFDLSDYDGKPPYILDMNQLMNTSLNEAIKYHRENGIPLSTFMKIEVQKNGRTMDMSRGEYRINWDELQLEIFNCNTYKEYRLLLSVHTKYLNELLDDIIHYKEEK